MKDFTDIQRANMTTKVMSGCQLHTASEEKSLLIHASALLHRHLTEFVACTFSCTAITVIDRSERLEPTERDFTTIHAALDSAGKH